LGSGILINNAINKYGKENFKKELICECKTKNKLNKSEKYWIKKLNSKNPNIGYNIAEGGQSVNYWIYYKKYFPEKYNEIIEKFKDHPVSSETREKLRQANLGKKYSQEINKKKGLLGSKNPFYGKKHSIETKQKISKTQSLKYKGINNPFYGKHHSSETREKLRQANLGKKLSNETKQKISNSILCSKNPFYGKHHSEETRKILSLKASLSHAKRKNDIEKIKLIEQKLKTIKVD
jgi:group I intron endonuclease